MLAERVARIPADRLQELLCLAAQVRDAQKAYFKHRTNGALIASKELEKQFDAALDRALDETEPRLFGAK